MHDTAPGLPRLEAAAPGGTGIERDVACVRCGYNLRTLSHIGACPECATPVQKSFPVEALARDVSCVRCRYSLRGLSPYTVCPECSTPIERSLRGDLLRFSAPEYVRSLHRGAFLVTLMFGGYLALIPLAVLLHVQAVGFASLLRSAVFYTMPALGFIGWWFLTRPEKPRIENDRHAAVRRTIRACVLVQVGQSVAVEVHGAVSAGVTFSPVAFLLAIVGFLAFATQFIAGLIHVRTLGRRIPDERLIKWATATLWASIPLALIFGFQTFGSTGTSLIWIIVEVLGALIVVLSYVSIIDRLRRSLKRVRRDAAAIHAAA